MFVHVVTKHAAEGKRMNEMLDFVVKKARVCRHYFGHTMHECLKPLSDMLSNAIRNGVKYLTFSTGNKSTAQHWFIS